MRRSGVKRREGRRSPKVLGPLAKLRHSFVVISIEVAADAPAAHKHEALGMKKIFPSLSHRKVEALPHQPGHLALFAG